MQDSVLLSKAEVSLKGPINWVLGRLSHQQPQPWLPAVLAVSPLPDLFIPGLRTGPSPNPQRSEAQRRRWERTRKGAWRGALAGNKAANFLSPQTSLIFRRLHLSRMVPLVS